MDRIGVEYLPSALVPFATPVNLTLTLVLLYLVYTFTPRVSPAQQSQKLPTTPTQYSWRPAQHPPSLLWLTLTLDELSAYNGIVHPRILFALRGKLYDVTSGKSFYGPGQSYSRRGKLTRDRTNLLS